MKRISIKRRLVGMLAAVGLGAGLAFAVSAPPAQASTQGNDLCVARTSTTTNSVRTANASFSIFSIYKAHCSYEYPSQKDQVQAFYVNANDHCESYWGYWYKSSRWYFFGSSNNTLTLYCTTIYQYPNEDGTGGTPLPEPTTTGTETLPWDGETEAPVDPIAYQKPAVLANHLTGNRVTYAGGGPVTCGSANYIYLDAQHPYANYDYVIQPCGSSYPPMSNVSCFIPTRTLYSYWNGVYSANNPRCFASSNNHLTLYAYQH